MNDKALEKTVYDTLTEEMKAPLPSEPTLPRKVSASPALAAPYGQPVKQPYVPNIEGYEHLSRILLMAYDQAASGKGKERHATSPIVGTLPWDQQPLLAISRMVGVGGAAYQVLKKAQESVTMTGNGNFAGAKAEALGAIVYAAALYKLYEEMEAASK